jgi:putative ABC transport system ATP-binding protein
MQCPTDHDTDTLVSLSHIQHDYLLNGCRLPVLRDISLIIRRGDTCSITGPSGSGKSTLLNLLGLLDRPSSGCLHFAGTDMSCASSDERARIRNRQIGFIFQAFHLLPRLSALDNVALPLSYRAVPRNVARQAAMRQLQRVGLGSHAQHRPDELSGGQCQRVAIGRALVGNPALIVADEPTGNLDQTTADEIIDLLLELNHEHRVTLVMVTHDDALAARLGRRLHMDGGRLFESVARHA